MTATRGFTAQPRKVRRRFSIAGFARNKDGATAIEFAFLATPFLLVLFAILETGISMAAQQLLVNATENVARQIRTGQIPTTNQQDLTDRICERIEVLVAKGCPGLRVDLRTYTSFQEVANQQIHLVGGDVALELDEKGGGKALEATVGGPKARQTLRAFYFWPVITKMLQPSMAQTGDGKKLLIATQTWQNEAY